MFIKGFITGCLFTLLVEIYTIVKNNKKPKQLKENKK